MQHTQSTVWKSVYIICPSFKVIRENKLGVNLPLALRDCAVQVFLHNHNKIQATLEFLTASAVIGDALAELSVDGIMNFADE